jgi:hypothetical protein
MYDVSRLLTGRGNRAARAVLSNHQLGETMTLAWLVEQLKDTVEPGSWKYAGRSLVAAENDPHTFVICQSEEVHREIDGLLDQLQRLADLRVLTTIEERSLDGALMEDFVREQKLAMPIVRLNPKQAEAFMKLKSTKGVGRNYVSFNGETFATTERSELQVMVSSDDSAMRVQQTSVGEQAATVKVDELHSGGMLLMDLTNDEAAKAGVRRYLTITPKVMRLTNSDSMRFERAPPRKFDTWGTALE